MRKCTTCGAEVAEDSEWMLRTSKSLGKLGAMDFLAFAPTRYFCSHEHMEAYWQQLQVSLDKGFVNLLSTSPDRVSAHRPERRNDTE